MLSLPWSVAQPARSPWRALGEYPSRTFLRAVAGPRRCLDGPELPGARAAPPLPRSVAAWATRATSVPSVVAVHLPRGVVSQLSWPRGEICLHEHDPEPCQFVGKRQCGRVLLVRSL